MTLWTIQPLAFYHRLQLANKINATIEFIDKDFLIAYDWMVIQMESRVSKRPSNHSYPIWAWYQYNSKSNPKPNLKDEGLLPKGTEGVCLEIEKKKDDVLLSDFLLWHFPLSYKEYIADSQEDLEAYEKLAKELELIPYENFPFQVKEKITTSWQKIFDLDFDFKYYVSDFENKMIQATFWELNISEVKQCEFFMAK